MDKEETRELHFTTDKVAVTAAGTKQQLTELYGNQTITIWADDGNTGNIYIGNRDLLTDRTMVIAPGGTLSLDLTTGIKRTEYIVLYIDAATSADSVRYIKI